MNRTIRLEGKCDRAFYKLDLAENEEIYAVEYRDRSLPKTQGGTFSVISALAKYRIPDKAKFLSAENPIDIAPDSTIAAYWMTRTVYTEFRRPAFYYYVPTKTITVFPAPMSDGDLILVGVRNRQPDPSVATIQDMQEIALAFQSP